MAGWIRKKPRVSLERNPAKGYQPSWAVDLRSDGRDLMGGKERGAAAEVGEGHGGAAIAGDGNSPE
jgi:hypothetical protein